VTAPTTATFRSDQRSALPGGIVSGQLRAHPFIGFFALAYAFSWLTLLALDGLLGLPAGLAILLQTLGPTFAALVMASVLDGSAGRRALTSRVRIWRVGTRWYAVVLFGLPIACLFAGLVLGDLGTIGDQAPVALALTYIAMVVVGGISGPLFEEPGWRGFALPRLQAQRGPLLGTLVLGVMWAAWHLPQFLVPEWAAQNGGSSPLIVLGFLLMVVAIAPVMTWIFNRTRGSLFMAMVAHACINASLAVFVAADVALATGLLAFGTISVVLVVATRGRLGYDASTAVTGELAARD
jgi:membrane protease YdiL (CAAX protease family)